MYDAIVIGAGPAGCTAAKCLSEKGCRVLLVEKFKMPRYKSCSGVLIKKSMDMVKLYFGEDVPSDTMCAPIDNRGMIFTNDRGREYRFEQEGLNVWRSSFDHWLAARAAGSGAEVLDNTAAIDCLEQNGYVNVTLRGDSTYQVEAKYVLDCEGVAGALKKKILGRPRDCITTFQTFNRGTIDLDPHYFYAYLQPELSEYDAWFNVKDQLLVLGVSVREPCKISHYYEQFLSYMERQHHLQLEKQMRSEKWLMPHILPGCSVDYGIGRIFFAGEIAGFLNPMGEGISSGMESGYCAASAVFRHMDHPDLALQEYQKDTLPLKTYMERQWSFVGGIADTFCEMKG